MPRRLVESNLSSKAARAALLPGTYWRSIDPEIHLGYRRKKAGGKWVVRYYLPALKTYRRVELGVADDAVSEGTLSYNAAVASARAAVEDWRRKAELSFDTPVPTVGQAVRTYMDRLDARETAREGEPKRSKAASCLKRYVLGHPPLAGRSLDDLSDERLQEWLKQLPPGLKPTTRQRIVTNLKAALNAAYPIYRKQLPKDFAEIVRIGLRLEAPSGEQATDVVESQILDDEDVRKIITSAFKVDADRDFGRLVLCLAATGARFSQVRRLRVRDLQPNFMRLMMPMSRKGRNKKSGYVPVRIGPDVLAQLMPIAEGRGADEPLFCRWRHVQTGPVAWRRDSRGAWKSASEMTRPWAAACKEAGLAQCNPYALRHSAIVRGIREGLPIRLVAALHDTSVAMIEQHYARWIADGLEELAARAIVPMFATG